MEEVQTLDCPNRANRFRVPVRTEPLFRESRFGALEVANRRFEAICTDRSNVLKIVFFQRLQSIARSAANGGLRDGGLSKSEDICGKRPFFSVFWISQALFAPSGKGRKGRKRAKKADFGRFPVRAARHPLSPHLLHPHLRRLQSIASRFARIAVIRVANHRAI